MTKLFFYCLITFVISTPLFASEEKVTLRGHITNGSTGEVAQAEQVSLIELKKNMQFLSTQQNVTGSYEFKDIAIDPEVPHLIQVSYKGIHYNTSLPPHQISESPIETTVYDVTQNRENIQLTRLHWIVQKENNQLQIQKIFILDNESNPPLTYASPEETLRFYIPEEAQNLSVSASTGSMPIPQTPTRIENSNDTTLAFPLKPGKTSVMISFLMESSNDSIDLMEKAYEKIEEMDLLLSPTDIQVEGPAFENKGVQSEIGFLLLTGGPFQKGEEIKFKLSGGTEEKEPQIVTIPNETQRFSLPICIGIFLILILGSIPILKRSKSNEIVSQKEALFKALIELEKTYQSGAITLDQYEKEKDPLKSQLLYLLKKNP
ncbi:MAG: hypothetical protein HYS08_08540 [Chlamydiae bacterium]|nr:hypothetical protein [Chlamydiota bacterium]